MPDLNAWGLPGRKLLIAAASAAILAGCGESPEAMVDSAKAFLAKDDFAAASIQLKNALQENGSLAEARFLLGKINLQQGDVQGAIKELRRAAQFGYPEPQVMPLLARAMVRAAEFDKVLAEFEGKRLESPAAQAQLLAAVGDAQFAKADVAKARETFEQAIALHPQEPSAHLGLGRALLSSREFDGALFNAEKVLAAQPRNAEALALKADAHLGAGQAADAMVALVQAVSAEPASVQYHFALVSLLFRENQIDDANRRLDEMKAAAPQHPLTRYLLAYSDVLASRLPSARDHIAESTRLAPNYLPGRLLAGSIHARLNDHVQAQQHLSYVLARAPGQPLARRLMALSLLGSGEPNRALETLQPMLDAGAKDSATLTVAGQIYLAKGEFDRASEFLAKVVAAEPEDAQARTRLGVSRMIAGDTDRALADLEAASDLDDSGGQPDVALVLAHLRRGNAQKALDAWGALAEKQPDHPQTHNIHGAILLAKRDVPGARSAFEKALAIKPDFLSAAYNLVRLDLAERKPEEARLRLERVIEANPKVVDAHLALADLLARTGGGQERVRSVLERAVSVAPTSVAPKVALVRFHLAVNDAKKALSIAQELAASHANDPHAMDTLGRAQFAFGDHQQAVAAFGRLASLQPNSPAPLIALADAMRATKDRAGAEAALKKALGMRADLIEAQQRLVAVLIEDSRPNEAIAIAREVARQRPGSAVALALEGDAMAATGNWSEAETRYRKSLAIAKTADIAIKLHAVQLQAGKRSEADRLAADWLKSHPEDVALRGYLAEHALAEQRYSAADQLYRRLNELVPDNPFILNNLAWVSGQLKHPDAIALAERAASLAPENAAVLDTLGMLQVEAGMAEKGLSNVRKAVNLSPEMPGLRLNLAKALIRMKQEEEARKELYAVLKQVPEGGAAYVEAVRLLDAM